MQNDSIDNLMLDLNKERVRGVIYVRAGDTRARTIHITLVSNGSVVDLSDAVFCEILIKKPDLNENDQTMVRVGNELQYTFRTQDINVPGECKCMVQVTFADDAVITSPEFAVMVYDKVIDPSHETSTNEYTAISQILVDVTNLKNQADSDVVLTEQYKNDAEGFKDDAEDFADEAEVYKDEAEEIARGLEGAILPQDGVITFADLDDVTMLPGFMWKISDEFTTDNRFVEGSGILMPEGTFVFITISEKFVCMTPTALVGVKGDNEVSYRVGKVNITKGNIGLGDVDNTSDADKPISDATQDALDDIGDNIGDLQDDISDIKDSLSTMSGTLTSLGTSVGNILNVLGYPYTPPSE